MHSPLANDDESSQFRGAIDLPLGAKAEALLPENLPPESSASLGAIFS
jgi:hypothetical protein